MYYNNIQTPVLIKTGKNILNDLDSILASAHLYFPHKILVTQENLYETYHEKLDGNHFDNVIFCRGGEFAEASELIPQVQDADAVLIAFGGGSVLDIVKYVASRLNMAFITVPSALSNDAIYSSVARLTVNRKKKSFNVQLPLGVILDLAVLKTAPRALLLAGAGDLITNISAVEDWTLATEINGETSNGLAMMLSKQAALSIWNFSANDLYTDNFLSALGHGLLTSGLSMNIAGSTRACSGSEHMISHAIDEYFPDKATMHGLQVAWAFREIERQIRKNDDMLDMVEEFYDRIGLTAVISEYIPWKSEDLMMLIPYALKIRKRFTVLNTVKL
jgi:glycerol-1-phosphate dehydrogenase [NAD(P)+]